MLTLTGQDLKAEHGLLQAVANDLAGQWDLLLILSDLHEEQGSPGAMFWRWIHEGKYAPKFGRYDAGTGFGTGMDRTDPYWAWADTTNCHKEWLYQGPSGRTTHFIDTLPWEVFNLLPQGMSILNRPIWQYYPSWQDAMTAACTAWAASSYARRK